MLPTRSVDVEPVGTMRTALVMHVHYMELLDQLLGYAASMPASADLIINVGSEDKKRYVEQATADLGRTVIVQLCWGIKFSIVARKLTRPSLPCEGAQRGWQPC